MDTILTLLNNLVISVFILAIKDPRGHLLSPLLHNRIQRLSNKKNNMIQNVTELIYLNDSNIALSYNRNLL